MAGNTVRILAVLDDKVTGKLGAIRDSFDRLGKSQGFKQLIQGMGIGAGIGVYNSLGMAVGKVTDFIGESIQKASDMTETLSKSGVVFGASAKSVENWGGTLARSFGISKQAGIEAAASFGNVFNGLGLGNAQATKMSKTLVELAGDLASFHNLATDDALQKLRSGLAGEAEPLRAVGVFLSEATIKARAMKMGLGDAHRELTEGEKVLARYAEILAQTTSAQGDAARTIGELAGQQRVANAALEDAQATLGQRFLPIELEVTRAQVQVISKVDLFSQALDMLTGKTQAASFGLEQQKAFLLEMADAYPAMRGEVDKAVTAIDSQIEAQGNLNTRMERGKDGAHGLGNAVAKVKDESRQAARVIAHAFNPSLEDMADKAGDAAEKLGFLLFGEQELKLESKLLADKVKDAEAKIRDLSKIKDPTREQREDLNDTKLELIDLKKETIQTDAKLAALGDAKAKQRLDKMLDGINVDLRTLDKETLRAILHLRTLAGLYYYGFKGGNERSSTATGGHALGGPVRKGQATIVGETGKELFVPESDGYIVPNHDLRSGSATSLGGTNIFINVHSSGVMTPSAAQKLANDLGPTIATYLRRQNLIPARV